MTRRDPARRTAPWTWLHRPIVPPTVHVDEMRRVGLPKNTTQPTWWVLVFAVAVLALGVLLFCWAVVWMAGGV